MNFLSFIGIANSQNHGHTLSDKFSLTIEVTRVTSNGILEVWLASWDQDFEDEDTHTLFLEQVTCIKLQSTTLK